MRNRARLALVVLVGSSLLVGCGFTKPEDGMFEKQAISQTQQRVACENRKAAQASAETEKFAQLSPEAQMMAVALESQYKIVQAATGHKVDDCNTGPTMNDVLIAEVKEKNETVRAVAPDIARTAGLTYFGAEVMKTMKAGIENAGNHTSTVNSGDGASSAHEHNQVTSNNTQQITADGENASATSPAPIVTGPDKSTVVEAPEIPVVEE